MAIIEYAGTLVELLSTDAKPNKPDGWYLREKDTGLSYFRRNGAWVGIANGAPLIGASAKSGIITTNGSGVFDVVFATAFASTGYSILLSCADDGTNQPAVAAWSQKITGGFRITTRYSRTGNIRANTQVSWHATLDFNL